MSITRPAGKYAGGMCQPPAAWPTADEDAHAERASELRIMLLRLDDAAEGWMQTSTSIFGGHTWSGQAADAGQGKVMVTSELTRFTLQTLQAAMNFHKDLAKSIITAKTLIVSNCNSAEGVIERLNSLSLGKEYLPERDYAIQAIVDHALKANEAVVRAAGLEIIAGHLYTDVDSELDAAHLAHNIPGFSEVRSVDSSSDGRLAFGAEGSNQSAPAIGNNSLKVTQGESAAERYADSAPTGTNAALVANAQRSRLTSTAGRGNIELLTSQTRVSAAEPTPPPPTSISPNSPTTASGIAPSATAPSSGSTSPTATNASSPTAKPGPQPDLQQPKGAAAGAKSTQAPSNVTSWRAPADQIARSVPATQAAPQPPVTATGAPPTPTAPAGSLGDSAAPTQHASSPSSISSPGPSAPAPQPLGPPATPPPAGPPPVTGSLQAVATSAGLGLGAASAGKSDSAATGVAPVPVSSVRRERDAAVYASTAAALKRRRGNASTALIQARRIAAALNMGAPVYGFFWVTGLATDGSIVVANSYGIGYIPDDVELPVSVTMASADESIPPAERGQWATYPVLALRRWAEAHDLKLRALIATAEQFGSGDAGVPKVILQSEDIPEHGRMSGRSRLAVIAPDVAARLHATADTALQDLLPAAPARSTTPEDRLAGLWFELTKPLMGTASTRGITHLRAFVEYAAHAQELALHRAHTAVDATAQRLAIGDWIYWQHLGVLMADAVNPIPVTGPPV